MTQKFFRVIGMFCGGASGTGWFEIASKRWLGKKLSFEEACDVVFRENHELLGLLAK